MTAFVRNVFVGHEHLGQLKREHLTVGFLVAQVNCLGNVICCLERKLGNISIEPIHHLDSLNTY
jgi:translation initiation factor 6 (eIF-6)